MISWMGGYMMDQNECYRAPGGWRLGLKWPYGSYGIPDGKHEWSSRVPSEFTFRLQTFFGICNMYMHFIYIMYQYVSTRCKIDKFIV